MLQSQMRVNHQFQLICIGVGREADAGRVVIEAEAVEPRAMCGEVWVFLVLRSFGLP